MSNPFYGDVLFLDRPTKDRRRIAANAPISARAGIPVFTHSEEDILIPLGEVDTADWPDDHTLTLAGTVDLPPGDYPCGVRLCEMLVEYPTGEDGQVDVTSFLFGDGEEVCAGGLVEMLAVYVGAGAENRPAWPGTHITVTEGATTR